MPALIYAPGVRAYVATARNGTVDISEDLVNGTMVRRSDGVSTFDFTVMNARRKYDQVFAPNDRIIVMMKRISWLRVFTGYLNSVPLRTAWPRDVSLSASCSLKRLQYYYWDPYAAASQKLMIEQISNTGTKKYAGGASSRQIQALLNEVVGWPLANIHIGSIPSNWYKIATDIGTRLKGWSDEAVEGYENYLESLGVDSEAIIKGSLVDRLRSSLDLDSGAGAGFGASSGFGSTGDPGLSGGPVDVPSSGSSGTPSSGGGGGGGRGVVSGQGIADALKGNSTPNTPIVGGTAPLGLVGAGSYGGVRLSSSQARVAVQMYNAAASYGGWRTPDGKHRSNIPIFLMITMFMAAMQESSLNNNATNGLGYYGLFQMDKNKLDGSVKARTNIRRSVHWFLDTALVELARNPKKYPRVTAEVLARLAEAVEISGHEERYRKYYEMAYQLTMSINRKQASRIGPSRNPNDPNNVKVPGGLGGPGYRGARQSGQVSGAQLIRTAVGLINNANPPLRYVYGGGHGGSDPRKGVDCSGFVSWVVRTASGGRTRFDGTSASMSSGTRRISVQEALRIPGALLFAPGHVEFSMGNGTQSVGAGSPRSGVKVRPASYNRWTHGGLIPGIGYNGKSGGTGGGGGGGGAPVRQHRVFPVPSHHGTSATFGETGSWSRYHTGTDFPAPTGTKVVAAQSGQVIHAGTGGSEGGWAGTYVVIQHAGNFRTVYAHLSSLSVGNGARVQGGQKIGEVGQTGRAFGSHLHFEVRKPPYKIYEGTINPMPWLRGSYEDSGGGGDTSGYIPSGTSGGGGRGVGLTGSLEPVGYVDHTYSESPLYDDSSPIDKMFAEDQWFPATTSTEALVQSASDIGALTIAHDSTVLQYLMSVCASSMRSFCSAPNGDFICWFPDYYGLWGTAAILRVEPIEVQDFNVNWSDDNFVTHQFINTSVSTGVDPGTGLLVSQANNFYGANSQFDSPVGFANIDAPEVMASLFGIAPQDHKTFARYVYQRFGARPNVHQVEAVLSKEGNYFMALYYFMLQWAYQYQAAVPVTFMPEAYPGMLMQIPFFNFQAYITSVTHQFQFGPGGSFSTSINIASPAYMPSSNGDHSLVGLPLAGGYRRGKLLAQSNKASQDSIGKVPEGLPGEGLVGGVKF